MEWKQEALKIINKYLMERMFKSELVQGVVCFMISGIGEREDWSVVGQTSIIPCNNSENAETMHIYFTIAQNVDMSLSDKITIKFMELNDMAVFGRLGINERGHIFYQNTFPVVPDKPDLAVSLFKTALEEMLAFIEAYYAYILVAINEPDKLTLKRYIELMLMED